MNPTHRRKLFFGGGGMIAILIFANALNAFAQGTAAPAAAFTEGNIISAMYGQVLSNPSSLLVIAFLSVFAWLLDDLPFINSRYVAHFTVMLGACIYWAFTTERSVPATFPHPFAVFVVNGTLCGFVAFVLHRQLVARLINLVRGRVTCPVLPENVPADCPMAKPPLQRNTGG